MLEGEVVDLCMAAQMKFPLYSEKAIMAVIGLGAHYLAERAKKSEILAELKERLLAIRERAWIEKGIEGLTDPDFNSTLYRWMTKQICRWREEPDGEGTATGASATPQIMATADSLRQMIEIARGGGSAYEA